MNKKRNPQDKNRNGICQYQHSAAELRCKHNIFPTTFQNWKDKFMQGCRQTLLNKRNKTKSHVKEVENLKYILG